MTKPFHRQGEYTLVHNAVVDFIMPRVSSNALRVLLFIIRKTVGWQKHSDQIPLSQIRHGTGIKTNVSALKAIDELQTLGVILVMRGARLKSGRQDINTYSLNLEWEISEAEFIF